MGWSILCAQLREEFARDMAEKLSNATIGALATEITRAITAGIETEEIARSMKAGDWDLTWRGTYDEEGRPDLVATLIDVDLPDEIGDALRQIAEESEAGE